MVSYTKVTDSLKITFDPIYTKDGVENHVWAYSIKIENLGGETFQLLKNYWQIPNDLGEVQCIKEDNFSSFSIEPGGSLEFIGGPPFTEASNIVIGSYAIANEKGETFEVHVPVFSIGFQDTADIIH